MLFDLLVLDVIFMILASNIKMFRNIVQIRGFFSGKILTIDVLKKEKIENHLEEISKRLHYLQNES